MLSLTKETAGIAALVLMVFQGIIQIQFGYKLLKLRNNLDGLLKPFSYLNMATGICIASIEGFLSHTWNILGTQCN